MLGTAATALLVGGWDAEMTDPRLNVQVLRRLAATSGGRLVTAADTGPLLDTLRARIPEAQLAVAQDLWHNGWSFGLVVALLGTEWALRRRWGLR